MATANPKIDYSRQGHYENLDIQPIDILAADMTHEEFAGYLRGNVIKYLLRAPNKNGIEDYRKAHVYLTWLIASIEKPQRNKPNNKQRNRNRRA